MTSHGVSANETIAPPVPVVTSVNAGVARVWLNRPDAGNAIDLPTATAFRSAVARLARDQAVRVIVLGGSGRLFCAGGDVRAMAAAADPGAFLGELAGIMHDALTELRRLPVPVIAAVQGTAAGAGIGLVLAADIAICCDTARFVAAYSTIGLSPDCGVTALLAQAVGPRRAALFALTNPVLTAAQALEWGLVSQACPPEDFNTAVDTLAQTVAQRPGDSAGETARLLRLAASTDYASQLAGEAAVIARLATTPDAAAAIGAFAAPKPGAAS